MKKTIISALLIIVAVICLTACSIANGTTSSQTNNSTNKKPSTTETNTQHTHSFGSWTVAKAATCSEDGTEQRVCSCGEKETRSISALGHIPDANFVCQRCGASKTVSMNSSQRLLAKSVQYLSNRSIEHYDDGFFRLFFGLKTGTSEDTLSKVPTVIEIRIENENGETVYTQTKAVSSSDYGRWGNDYKGYRTLCAIEIKDSEIIPGSSSKGTIYFTITNYGYFSFPEQTLDITNHLPVSETDIVFNNGATSLGYNSSGVLTNATTVTITDLTAHAGEKEIKYSVELNRTLNSGRSHGFYVYLFDEDGYQIGSDYLVASNDKSRSNESFYSDVILENGKTYYLKLENEANVTSDKLQKIMIITGMYGGYMNVSITFNKLDASNVESYKFFVDVYNSSEVYYGSASYTVANDDDDRIDRLLCLGKGDYNHYILKMNHVQIKMKDGSVEEYLFDFSKKMYSVTSFDNVDMDKFVFMD